MFIKATLSQKICCNVTKLLIIKSDLKKIFFESFGQLLEFRVRQYLPTTAVMDSEIYCFATQCCTLGAGT